jgi:hypothetical protein
MVKFLRPWPECFGGRKSRICCSTSKRGFLGVSHQGVSQGRRARCWWRSDRGYLAYADRRTTSGRDAHARQLGVLSRHSLWNPDRRSHVCDLRIGARDGTRHHSQPQPRASVDLQPRTLNWSWTVFLWRSFCRSSECRNSDFALTNSDLPQILRYVKASRCEIRGSRSVPWNTLEESDAPDGSALLQGWLALLRAGRVANHGGHLISRQTEHFVDHLVEGLGSVYVYRSGLLSSLRFSSSMSSIIRASASM